MKKILVIGSMSTDFVVTTNQKPEQGETVFGESFGTVFGGKGANQAVAASRLGSRTAMFGRVGDDVFGEKIKENLLQNGVNTENVEPVPQQTSGSAHITLFEGDNSIIVIPGANNALTPDMIEEQKELILESSLVILQNEIPQETNEAVIEFCYENKIPVMYNPAPARPLSHELIEKITYLTPNQHEFAILFPGMEKTTVLKDYPNKLIITMGAEGALFYDGKRQILVPTFPVEPIDTTGAGDTFNGALAAALLNGLEMEAAIRFANLAASLSVQGFGAQGGMPTLEEMKRSEKFEETWHFE